MLVHLRRVNDVMCFKHLVLYLFLVQKKKLIVNVGEISEIDCLAL